MTALTEKNRIALELFEPLAETYDRYARLLSFGQDPRWRSFLVSRIGAAPNERVVDVACGTGAVALRAARLGADVIGVDIAPRLVETARRLAAEEGLDVRFDVGDAEALPYPDASFDVVASSMGAIFAPSHREMATELARVCRSGGRLGLAAWRPNTMFSPVTRKYRDVEPGADDSDEWGREGYARRLLADAFELEFEQGDAGIDVDSPDDFFVELAASVGPFRATFEGLDRERADAFRREFVGFIRSHPTNGSYRLPADFVLIFGRRR